MSKHVNYNKMHNYAPNNDEQVEAVVEENVVEETAIINEPVVFMDDPVVEETVEVVEEPVAEDAIVEEPQKFAIATVVNCNSLNLREHPSTEAKVLSVLEKNTELQVEITNEFDAWFHVYTATGLEGFCMKQYIAVKE